MYQSWNIVQMALFLRYHQRFLPTLDKCHCFTVNIGNYLPRSLELDKKSPFEAFFFVPPLIWNPFTTALPTSSGQEARLMFKENCKNWHLKPRRREFHFLVLDYNWQLEFQYEGSILVHVQNSILVKSALSLPGLQKPIRGRGIDFPNTYHHQQVWDQVIQKKLAPCPISKYFLDCVSVLDGGIFPLPIWFLFHQISQMLSRLPPNLIASLLQDY